MAKFSYGEYQVHYEVHGKQGKPLLILNGIMMSTSSWKPFLKDFSNNNIVILVDFIDQGHSSRATEQYTHDLQVELVNELLKLLPYEKVAIAGISYGGEIAMEFAIKYPEKVSRLILANTAARTSVWLGKIGESWKEVAKTKNGYAYYLATVPIIYSAQFFEENTDWMRDKEQAFIDYFSREDVLDSLKRITGSSRPFNIVNDLCKITCPTLVISGSEDRLLPPREQKIIHEGIKKSIYVTIDGSGHASMYENPSAFASLVLGFANLCDDGIQI